MRRKIAVAALAVMALAACGDKDRVDMDISDEDVDAVVVPWTLYVNYDDHPNVATRCDGTTRMYTTTRASSALIVVPTSPECRVGQE